jgi:N4-gp56 family major capsid protein
MANDYTTGSAYNDPANGSPSSVGNQNRTNLYKRKALVLAQEEFIFGQFANKEVMPMHYGKEIVQDLYLPILHDGNFTDQGIDADGLSTVQKVTITIIAGVVKSYGSDMTTGGSLGTLYAVGEGADAAAALVAAKVDAVRVFTNLNVFDTDYDTTVAAVEAYDTPWTVVEGTSVAATGNLYGSSRDIGNVSDKLPGLGEFGGRVNRVGSTRVTIKSQMRQMGIFDEYSAESYQFDSDAQREMHAHREMLRTAAEVSEDALQIDLINGAGLVRFGGDALATEELTGETGASAVSVATYADLMRLDIDLTSNKAPKKIKAILGSTKNDTKTVDAARVLIVGPELIPTLKAMTDSFGRPAFINVREYADASKPMNGEIGAIDAFRIIVSTRMMHFAGAGATVSSNAGYRETNGKYDVFPMLAISADAFSEVSFHTPSGGKTGAKWEIMHKKPGKEMQSSTDPFGKTGIRSIAWWYGSLISRPEWIGLVKVVALQ